MADPSPQVHRGTFRSRRLCYSALIALLILFLAYRYFTHPVLHSSTGNFGSPHSSPTSTPAPYDNLRLARSVTRPFRFIFNVEEGDPAKPDTLAFQINTIDVHQPSQFVGLNKVIVGTHFKTIRFKSIQKPNYIGSFGDMSELTIQNMETGDEVVLRIGRVVDIPDHYAVFRDLGNNTQFEVKKNQDFAIPPDTVPHYKLIDVNQTQAIIQTPAGQKVTVPAFVPPPSPRQSSSAGSNPSPSISPAP